MQVIKDFDAVNRTFIQFMLKKYPQKSVERCTEQELAECFDELEAVLMKSHNVSAWDFFAAKQDVRDGSALDVKIFEEWKIVYSEIEKTLLDAGLHPTISEDFEGRAEISVFCEESQVREIENVLIASEKSARKCRFSVFIIPRSASSSSVRTVMW